MPLVVAPGDDLGSRSSVEIVSLAWAVQQRVYRRMWRPATDRRPRGAVQLQGTSGTSHRVLEGDWRILYTIEDDRLVVCVVRVAHRREAYR